MIVDGDAFDPPATAQEPAHLAVISRLGAGSAGRAHQRPHETGGVGELAVPEQPGAIQAGAFDLGAPLERLAPGQEARPGYPALGIREAAIAVERQRLEQGESRPQRFRPPHAVTEGRYENRHRTGEVRRDAKPRGPFPARFADPRDVEVLEIADAAVNHLE